MTEIRTPSVTMTVTHPQQIGDEGDVVDSVIDVSIAAPEHSAILVNAAAVAADTALRAVDRTHPAHRGPDQCARTYQHLSHDTQNGRCPGLDGTEAARAQYEERLAAEGSLLTGIGGPGLTWADRLPWVSVAGTDHVTIDTTNLDRLYLAGANDPGPDGSPTVVTLPTGVPMSDIRVVSGSDGHGVMFLPDTWTEARLARLEAGLQAIASRTCEVAPGSPHLLPGYHCKANGRYADFPDPADRMCAPCVAHLVLAGQPLPTQKA